MARDTDIASYLPHNTCSLLAQISSHSAQLEMSSSHAGAEWHGEFLGCSAEEACSLTPRSRCRREGVPA